MPKRFFPRRESPTRRRSASRTQPALGRLLELAAVSARAQPQPPQAEINALEQGVARLVQTALREEDEHLTHQLEALHQEIRRVAQLKTLELDTLRRESEAEIAYQRAEYKALGCAKAELQQELDHWQQEAQRFRELHRQEQRRSKGLDESMGQMIKRVQLIWPQNSDRPQPDQHDLLYLRKGRKSPVLQERLQALGRG